MRYGPADSSKTPRFTGVRTFMRLPYVETLEDVDVAVIGMPTDDAVSFKSGRAVRPGGDPQRVGAAAPVQPAAAAST